MQNKTFVFFDCETTGTNVEKDRIIEIAACKADSQETFSSLISVDISIPEEATRIHGISNQDISDAPSFFEVFPKFVQFCGDNFLVAHNGDNFDVPILKNECSRHELELPKWIYIDSLKWARKYCPHLPRHSLQYLRQVFNLSKNRAHRALDDVITLKQIFALLVNDLKPETVFDLLYIQHSTPQGNKFIMPFGKYQGKLLQDVPPSYIKWLKEQGALDKPENQGLCEAINVCIET